MSFLLPCPNCGPRDVAEYSYGGQIAQGGSNLPEVQVERWYHRFGCGRWLVARRDVRTNTVLQIGWLQEVQGGAWGGAEPGAEPAGGTA